jgi:hypothetical protein
MTKNDFFKMEQVCKDMWKVLSCSGEEHKPPFSSIFKLSCPACTIASGISGELHCDYCPITIWREWAMNDPLNNQYACEIMPKYDWHEQFCDAYNSDERRPAARKISEMEWSWLPEYENIKLSSSVIVYLNSITLRRIQNESTPD